MFKPSTPTCGTPFLIKKINPSPPCWSRPRRREGGVKGNRGNKGMIPFLLIVHIPQHPYYDKIQEDA